MKFVAHDLSRLPGEWTSPGVWVSAEELEAELRRELPADHVLADKTLAAVAVKRHLKDVIFWLPIDRQWALVHLTHRVESDSQWPSTSLVADWDALVAELAED